MFMFVHISNFWNYFFAVQKIHLKSIQYGNHVRSGYGYVNLGSNW